jgi:hypothetical protein
MKTFKIIALFCAISIFAVSCGEEKTVSTNDGATYNLSTTTTPVGGWTAEEQDLITKFGGITAMPSLSSNSKEAQTQQISLPGSRELDIVVELGDASDDCCGDEGWCTIIYVDPVDSDPLAPNLGPVRLNFVLVDWIKCSILPANGDTIPGLTANGLLPIEDYVTYDNITIYPGLYQVDPDSSNIIYIQGIIEE